MTTWLGSERWPQCPKNDAIKLTGKRLEKHWAWVQHPECDKISLNLQAITVRLNIPRNNYSLLTSVIKSRGSCHGKVINKTEKLFPPKLVETFRPRNEDCLISSLWRICWTHSKRHLAKQLLVGSIIRSYSNKSKHQLKQPKKIQSSRSVFIANSSVSTHVC